MAGRDRSFWRRLLGAVLMAYGAAGVLLVVGGSLLVASSVSRLDGLAGTIETQRDALVRSLDSTAAFLKDARVGTGNVGKSLDSTVDSARQVAALTRSLGSAMDQVASASQINILGSQPFAGLSGTFADVATQATALGTSLDRTADSLSVNGDDLTQVSTDLAAIEAQINEVRGQVAGAADGAEDLSAAAHAIDTSRLVLFGLLVWLAAQAVIAFVVGVVLLRWSPADPEVGAPRADAKAPPLNDQG